ncbi:hypothetical protein Tsubulata_016000 [Turnera subulata]|uniref:Uncharacterized protein n=1 Tax=Turnera subulata TaxID=218843 RepID=A0A9Q0J795_9ROSI|nr:hypothetical protein Tsubulata_016000 [Turnera subulata]
MAVTISLPLNSLPSSSPHYYQVSPCSTLQIPLVQRWRSGFFTWRKMDPAFPVTSTELKRRRTLICAVNRSPEEAFKKTVEVDMLIDTLRNADPKEERIELATDVLKAILKPVTDEEKEISWPPRDPEALKLMEKEIIHREREGQLDEGFLSEVNAQLRQAKEDGDKPGLEAMLQKVLQLYASTILSKRSYAKKGDEVLKDEQFLETIIKAPQEGWNKLLIDGLTVGKGEISPEELYAVVRKRIERILIRTEGGSYEQRVVVEYLRGIQSRAEEIVQVLQGKQ